MRKQTGIKSYSGITLQIWIIQRCKSGRSRKAEHSARSGRVRNNKEQQKRGVGDKSELYQFSSVYRHLVLNKYAVVRGGFDTRSASPYYLCTVVLFDISKYSDIVNGYELFSGT